VGSAELIERGDLNELTRHVDRLCAARDWAGLLDLRDRCRAALARGRQLWPIASHAEYRLALEAPGEWAARVLEPGLGRYALGPLPEVAASTHAWVELRDHVDHTPPAAIAAHERVVRGEDLRDDAVARALPPVLDIPLARSAWEPAYPVAAYAATEAQFADVPVPALEEVTLPAPSVVSRVDEPDVTRALVELATAWTTESNGRAEAIAVQGDALDALAGLGLRRARVTEVGGTGAMAVMAWTAASGGAHGRRRGMAAGRFAAWWSAAALTGLLDGWPLAADELGDAIAELRWYRFDTGEPDTGWSLRLVVEDPTDGLAFAVSATDARF
jgi:hypothetical protein